MPNPTPAPRVTASWPALFRWVPALGGRLRARLPASDALDVFNHNLLGSLDARQVARTIAREAAALVRADGVGISLVADDNLLVESTVNTGTLAPVAGQSLPRTGSLAGWCVATGQAALINDARRDPRIHPSALEVADLRRVLAAPLELAERFGAIVAVRSGPHARPFCRRDLQIWCRVAQIVALAWSNARLYDNAVRRRQRLEELYGFTASLGGSVDARVILEAVTSHAARMLGADAATLVMSDGTDVVYRARYGPGEFTVGFRRAAGDSLAGRVIREGRSLRVADASKDPCVIQRSVDGSVLAVLAVPVLTNGVAVGSLAALQYAPRVFTDEEEEPLRLLADATGSLIARARAFAELHRLHQRFLGLFHAMPDGALLVNRDGIVELANPAAERVLIVRPGELAGAPLERFVPEAQALLEWLFDRSAGSATHRGRLRRADGQVRDVEWRVNQLEGEGDRRVICTVHDRTDELRETAALRTLAVAVGAMRDGVMLVDHEGIVRFVNQAAARMHGYGDPAELVGCSVGELVPAEFAAEFARLLPVMREDGWSGEAKARHRDGHVFPVQLAVSPIRLDDDHVSMVVLIADLTERRSIEQRALAADKLATLGRLVAGVAHEINNPLAAVLGNAQFALEAVRPGEPVREALEVIATETRRAARIVKDMLSFARQDRVEAQRFDLRNTVTQVLRLREGYHRGLGIRLRCELPAEEARVLGDPDQVQQVLLNLVVNAEQALRRVRVPRIRIALEQRGASWRLLVEDSGPGIPADLRIRVFEPFFTTKPEGEGTGLGLSVSYGIAREHGGSIWIQDSELGGAGLVLELPDSPGVVGSAGRVAPQLQASLRASRRPMRILVVDDEAAIRTVAKRVLEGCGHRVQVAVDGQAAAALADAHGFDLILCDVRMPNLSGPELFARIQRRDLASPPRFVVMTGDIADVETHRFVTGSGVRVLLKPFELRDLVAAVDG